METIHKYELKRESMNLLMLPKDATILDIQIQATLCAWVKLNPNQEKVDRYIALVGTGQPMPAGNAKHISTIQDGAMVWHFFEI